MEYLRNVLSALIQNFDTVEKVIETSADSAGSALKENERYLDSIQGKIDQFNNAMQAMWSNILDSDVVKGFVSWGTKIIKSLDTIQGKFLAIVKVLALFMAYKKINPFDFIKDVSAWMDTIKDGGGLIQYLKSLLGLAPAMKVVTAETIANTVATQMNDAAKAKQMMSEMGLAGATGTLSAAQKEQAATAILNAMSTGQLTVAQGNAMLAMLGYSGATMAADGSLKALDATTKSFMASNPIGWILLAVSAIMMVVVAISKIPSKIEKLNEDLSDLRSEISSIETEINSINSELETTQSRIAELVAMPSLSFVEQEELDKLIVYNDQLERNKQIEQGLLESKQGVEKSKTEKYIDSVWHSKDLNKKYYLGEDGIQKDEGWNGFWNGGTNTKVLLDNTIRNYEISRESYNKLQGVLSQWDDDNAKANKKLLKQYGFGEHLSKSSLERTSEDHRDAMEQYAEGINMILSDENFANLKYGMSEKINTFLDEYYAYQYKWQEAQGVATKSSAITSIFDDTSSKSIQGLKESLRKIADNSSLDAAQKQEQALKLVNDSINSTTGNYDRLKTSMDVIGITADEVARYFVQMSSAPDSSTVEGLTAQYQKGVDALGKYKGVATDIIAEFTDLDGTVEQITWSSLFDDEGEAIDAQISKVLQGADETARTEFARIVEAVNEGKMSVDNAMKSFSVSGVQAGYKLLENAVVEINSDIFKDLGDEISGLIDTFDEFGSALESVANSIELVNQAQAEMAYSGHVSVETALDLIDSTDNWNEILKIENGNITLVDGAMDTLAQSKLNQIKTNLQLALSEAQAGLEQARLAENSGEVAKTLEESTTESVRQLAANMAYLSTLIGEFLDGNFLGANSAAKAAKDESLTATEYQKTDTTSSMSVADWEKKVSNIESKLSILEGVDTTGEFESNYSSDEVSGGNATKEDVEENTISDGWEKLLAEYENKLALITNERDLIEAEIDKAEARGGKASAKYYEDLIRNSNEEKALLEQKKAALEEYLAANAGNIDQDTWTEYNNEINETAVAIKECEVNTIEWAEAIREIDLHYFEQITDEVSRLGEELDFVNSLLEDEEVSDENGNWSSAALTRMGLYTQQMEKAAAEAAMYQDEIDKVNEQYEEGALSEEQYQEKLSDLVSGQQDAIQSYEDAKDSIVEMNEARIDAIREGIEKEIEAYEDLIDAKKEELDAERDLHDFREDVKNQTKDIASLERRIAALSGSSAASDVAERRKLEAQLLEAKEGLNNTYYGHSRDAQSAALDEEAEAYTLSKERYIEQLEEQLKDTETLIENSIMDVMLNADLVYTELNELADLYGIDLSESLTLPWKNASAQAIKWKDELKASMTSGEYAALIGEGGAITGFANGVATKLKGSWTTAQTAAKNYAGYLTGTELKNRFTNTLTGFGNQIQTIIDKWNGVRKAADDAYAAQTRKVTVGGTGSGSEGNDTGNDTPTTPSYTPAPKPAPKETVKLRGLMKTSREMILGPKSFVDKNTETINGTKYYRDSKTGYYYKISDLNSKRKYDGGRTIGWAIPKGTWFYTKHAKGTTGTDRDEWAITDEPQFGDELVLVPGKDGNLSFMRKGTGVVPADMTQKLFELAQIPTSDLMNKNLTAIVPNITKNDFKNEFNFESLVHVDTVDSDTLPKLEKMVDKKIDDFSKALNYSIKRFAR